MLQVVDVAASGWCVLEEKAAAAGPGSSTGAAVNAAGQPRAAQRRRDKVLSITLALPDPTQEEIMYQKGKARCSAQARLALLSTAWLAALRNGTTCAFPTDLGLATLHTNLPVASLPSGVGETARQLLPQWQGTPLHTWQHAPHYWDSVRVLCDHQGPWCQPGVRCPLCTLNN